MSIENAMSIESGRIAWGFAVVITLAMPSARAQSDLFGAPIEIETLGASATLDPRLVFPPPGSLSPETGFRLTFLSLRVLAEGHDTALRAGFSILVKTSDSARGVELGFFESAIFKYEYSVLTDFVPSTIDRVDIDTRMVRSYELRVFDDRFELWLGGGAEPLFAGALVDYSPVAAEWPTRGLGVLVYAASDLLALGDNTSRARSHVTLQGVVLDALPEPRAESFDVAMAPLPALLALALALQAVALRRSNRGGAQRSRGLLFE